MISNPASLTGDRSRIFTLQMYKINPENANISGIIF